MSDKKASIFISYARKDGSVWAEKLDRALCLSGYNTWRDTRGIDPSQDFTAEIERAIENSSHVVTCITEDARRDDSFVRREIQYAMLQKRPLIIARFEDVPPPIHVVTHTWIDFFKDWHQAFTQLSKVLDRPHQEKPTTADHPFQAYLEALYEQIVDFLDKTVFSLIPLHSEASEGAVDTTPYTPVTPKQLPIAFRGFRGMAVKEREISRDTSSASETSEIVRFSDFPHAFNTYEGRILLLGDPGAGKTTTIMAFAREAVTKCLADPGQPLPILAPVGRWPVEKGALLIDWLANVSGLEILELHDLMEQGKALFLLDGLDELGSERIQFEQKEVFDQITTQKRIVDLERRYDPRRRFIEELKGLAGHNQIVVSCRAKDYEQIGEKIQLTGAVHLQPLDDDQMALYLVDHPDLFTALQADDDLREMVRTPLLLSLLTFAYSGMGEEARELRNLKRSPDELRDAIFTTYIERRYEFEESRQNVQLPLTLQKLYSLMGQITFDLLRYSSQENTISVRILKDLLQEEMLPFVQMTQQLHLLVRSRVGQLRFLHLLLRDHFAFPYCVQQLASSDHNVRLGAIRALGRIGDKRAIEPLRDILSDTTLEIRYFVAVARSLSQVGDPEIVQRIIENVEVTETAETRAELLEILGYSLDDQVLVPLINRLSDPNQIVRQAAIEALEKQGQNAVPFLIENLRDENSFLRSGACEVLGRINDIRAIAPLLTALGDTNQYVRFNASNSLLRFGGQCVDILVQALEYFSAELECMRGLIRGENDLSSPVSPPIQELYNWAQEQRHWLAEQLKDQTPRNTQDLMELESRLLHRVQTTIINPGSYVSLLGQIGDSRVVELLLTLFADKELWPDFRASVAEALGEVGDNRATQPLVESMHTDHLDLRQSIVEALGLIGDKRAVQPLLELLGKSDDIGIYKRAIQSLGQIGDNQAVDMLLQVLSHSEDNEVTEQAIIALGKIGDVRAVDLLTVKLDDPNWQIRRLVVVALSNLEDIRIVKPLVLAMRDSVWEIQETAIAALSTKSHISIEPLKTLLIHEDSYLRRDAAKILDELDWQPSDPEERIHYLIAIQDWEKCAETGADAILPLIHSLKDQQPEVRRGAASALGKIGNVEAVEPLINALQDNSEEVRATTAQALGLIGDLRGGEALLLALEDEADRVRHRAAEALGQLQFDEAIPHLIEALGDRSRDVQYGASNALIAFNEKGVDCLVVAIESENQMVQANAAYILGQIGDFRAVGPLVNMLQDLSLSTWKDVAEALVSLGALSTEQLLTLIHSDSIEVQVRAVQVLGNIGDKRAVEPLSSLLGSSGRHVLRNVKRALQKIQVEY